MGPQIPCASPPSSSHPLARFLLTVLLWATLVPSALSQCCVKFESGQCVQCSADTRLANGNCLLNKPNCMEYNLFDCVKCEAGYLLDNDQRCVSAQLTTPTGYFFLTQQQINSTQIQDAVQGLSKGLSNTLTNPELVTVMAYSNSSDNKLVLPLNQSYYFKFIFFGNQGLYEATMLYNPNTNPPGQPSNEEMVQIEGKEYFKNKNAGEEFIDFRNDPNINPILTELEARNIYRNDTKLIDVFRSLRWPLVNISLSYGYRIFIAAPEKGLFFVEKTVPVTDIDFSNLDSKLKNIIDAITLKRGWNQTLSKGIFNKIATSSRNGIVSFNVSYRFPGKVDNQGALLMSWFFFTYDNEKSIINVLSSSMAVLPVEPAKVKTESVTPSLIPNPKIKLINPGVITMRPLPTDLLLQSYVNVGTLFNNETFSNSAREYIFGARAFQPGLALLSAAGAETDTLVVFQIEAYAFNLEQTWFFYTFIIDKSKSEMEVSYMISSNISNRTDVIVDDSNRSKILDGLDNPTKSMIKKIVQPDPLYSPNSRLFQIKTVVYRLPSSLSTRKRISLRYYYPDQLNSTYEYVEFRADLAGFTNASMITKLNKVNTIVYPREKFGLADEIAYGPLRDLVVTNLKLNSSIDRFRYGRILSSFDRPDTYRIEAIFNETYIVTYEIQSNFFRMIINRTLSPQTPSPTGANSSQQLPPDPIPQSAYSPDYLISYFPSKTTKPMKMSNSTADPTILAAAEIKKYIAEFFNVTPESILSVTVVERETLENLIDTYYVEFTRATGARTNIKGVTTAGPNFKFAFQIDRKAKKLTSIANAAANSQQQDYQDGLDGFFSFFAPFFNFLQDTIQLGAAIVQSIIQSIITPILIPIWEVEDKPLNVLEGIFGTPFKQLNQSKPRKNLPSKPAVNANQQTVSEFLKRIPSIIPLRYQEDPTFPVVNFSQIDLGKPNKPTTQVLNLVNSKVNTPSIFNSNLAVVESQRSVANLPLPKNNVTVVKIAHIYYGNIRLWTSLGEDKINQVDYVDKGFWVATAGLTILKQIPELANIQTILSAQISKILSYFGYSENKTTKVVNETDIIYWRYKRVSSVSEIEFFYEFRTFIIRAKVLLNHKDTQASDVLISELLLIDNNKRSNKNESQKMKMLFKAELRRALNVLYSRHGNLFLYSDVVDVVEQPTPTGFTYLVTYLTPSGFIKANLSYSNVTKQTNVVSISDPVDKMDSYVLEGCKTVSDVPLQCKECKPEYYLHDKDKLCYIKLENCLYQAREVCLECGNGFFLTPEYKCK